MLTKSRPLYINLYLNQVIPTKSQKILTITCSNNMLTLLIFSHGLETLIKKLDPIK